MEEQRLMAIYWPLVKPIVKVTDTWVAPRSHAPSGRASSVVSDKRFWWAAFASGHPVAGDRMASLKRDRPDRRRQQRHSHL